MLSFVLSLAAGAAALPSQWMIGVSGGTVAIDGDRTRGYGAVALTRRLGRAYVRASVTRFSAAVRQVDVTLPSDYTIAFLSGGTTLGPWFVDGYGLVGRQHYRPIRTPIGTKPIAGSTHSGVQGLGGDVGYVAWLNPAVSLTPSLAGQVIGSTTLREQVGPAGPSEYETRETGATFSGTLRLDHWFGPGRGNDVGIHLTRFITTNRSAALVAGTRGGNAPAAQSGHAADGWAELGGNSALRLNDRLYLDASLTRTFGAAAGDVTTSALGIRILF